MIIIEKDNLRNLQNSTSSNSTSNLLSDEHVWGAAIGVSLGLLVLSFILTLLVLCCEKSKRISKNFLNVINSALISLSIGSLFGDVIIHIVPDLFGEHKDLDDDNKPNPPIISLVIVIGFLTFFTIEKLFLSFGVTHSHGIHEEEKVSGRHEEIINVPLHENLLISPADPSPLVKIDKNKKTLDTICNVPERETENNDGRIKGQEEKNAEIVGDKKVDIDQVIQENKFEDQIQIIKMNSENLEKNNEIKQMNLNSKEKKINISLNRDETANTQIKDGIFNFKNKKPVGIMSIIASIIHNTLDGVALGIVFASKNTSVILSTCLAVIFHEIPKELGDAGILINAKFSLFSVLFWNVSINIFCIVGAIIGVAAGEISEVSQSYALAFVSGNFLYIALTDMIPEIIHKKGVMQTIIQFLFIIIGLGIMFIILLFEADE